MSSSIEDIVADLLKAHEAKIPIPPVRTRISGAAAAYEVQRRLVSVWQSNGRPIIGRKIGLTSKVVQKQIGVSEPDFGALFPDMLIKDGGSVPDGLTIQPRVEGEIAFVLKADLHGEVSPSEVIQATDFVCPAIEICDSRIARWDIRLEDTLADNASSGLFVLGSRQTKPDLEMLQSVSMELVHNSKVTGVGRGEECLGNPANAVAWLSGALTRFGDGLRKGDIVLSGALTKMVAAEPDSHFEANFGGLGSVRVSFSRESFARS